MSDERIPSRAPSPTLYDYLGIPDDEILPFLEDGLPTYEFGTSTLVSDITQDPSTLLKHVGTANEDQAILFLLRSGISPDQIIKCVKAYKDSKEAGNHEALETISNVQTEELLERIRTVEARFISSAPAPPIVPVSPIMSMPPIVPVPAAIPTPMKLKREPSRDFDEKPESSSQGVKRARTASMEDKVPGSIDAPKPIDAPEPTAVPEPTDIPRPAKRHRRGCPGNFWGCKPAELRARKYWTSFKKFPEHFESHMEDYCIKGHRWKCDLCDDDSFGGDGYDLIKHLWDTHFE